MCAFLCSEWNRMGFPSGQSEWLCHRNGTSVLGWSPRTPLRGKQKPLDIKKRRRRRHAKKHRKPLEKVSGFVLTGAAHATAEGVSRAARLGVVMVDVSNSRGQSVSPGAGAWTTKLGGMGAWREMMQQTHRFKQCRSWWFPCAAVWTVLKVLQLDTLSHSLTAIWGL